MQLDTQADPPNGLLFADDVEVLALNDLDLQHHLDIVSIWAFENRTLVGIKKCGAMSPDPDWEFHLSVMVLPRVDVYKYLGFPHRQIGIDFIAHYNRMAD